MLMELQAVPEPDKDTKGEPLEQPAVDHKLAVQLDEAEVLSHFTSA